MKTLLIALAGLSGLAILYFCLIFRKKSKGSADSIPSVPAGTSAQTTSPCTLKPALKALLAARHSDPLSGRLLKAAQDALQLCDRHALNGRAPESDLAWKAARELFEAAVATPGSARESTHVTFVQNLRRLQELGTRLEPTALEEVSRHLNTAERCFVRAYEHLSEGYTLLPDKSFLSADTHIDVVAALLGLDAVYGNRTPYRIAVRLHSARTRAASLSTNPALSAYIAGALTDAQRNLHAGLSDVDGGYFLIAEDDFRDAIRNLDYFDQLADPARHSELPAAVRCTLGLNN